MRIRRWGMAPLMASVLAMAVVSQASAAELVEPAVVEESVQSCTAPALSTALAAYGDDRSYFTAPGGDFEDAEGWQLRGGAALTGGSSPLGLGGGMTSLRLPAGSSATSPVFCVDLDYPTFRFWASQAAGRGLAVDVIYPGFVQNKVQAAANVKADAAWTLVKDVKLKPAKVESAWGWRHVAIRFRATAETRVDDVLIDPRMRG
ncbi:MAG: hypothetical protein QOD81_2485 [Solirubrobacteraceae bacterium]|nr:hypothetical protein [Solirubrobacteraceae bacterium]